MCYVWWICLFTFITKVCGQCSGITSKSTVGYTATNVNSPNYDNGYSINLACSWQHSTSVAGSSLLVQVNATVDCTGDDLSIYDGTGSTGLILHTCTQTTPSYVIASTGSVYTSFTTDSTTSAAEKGFEYNIISGRDFSGSACSSAVTVLATKTKAFISSPSFPNEYPSDSDCTWRIERSDNTYPMELSFNFIDIEYEANGPCAYDSVKITDDATGTTVLTTCGNNQWFPTQKYTTKGNVTIQFHSDATQDQRGFLLTYYVQDSSTKESDSSCLFDNCVILPVLITVSGIVLIAIVTCIIVCIVSKTFSVHRTVTVSMLDTTSPVQKKSSLKRIIIPLLRNNKIFSKHSESMFEDPDDDLIMSRPPLENKQMILAETNKKHCSKKTKFIHSTKDASNKISSKADHPNLKSNLMPNLSVKTKGKEFTRSKETASKYNEKLKPESTKDINRITTRINGHKNKPADSDLNKEQKELRLAMLTNANEIHLTKLQSNVKQINSDFSTEKESVKNTKTAVLKATNSKKPEGLKVQSLQKRETSEPKHETARNVPLLISLKRTVRINNHSNVALSDNINLQSVHSVSNSMPKETPKLQPIAKDIPENKGAYVTKTINRFIPVNNKTKTTSVGQNVSCDKVVKNKIPDKSQKNSDDNPKIVIQEVINSNSKSLNSTHLAKTKNVFKLTHPSKLDAAPEMGSHRNNVFTNSTNKPRSSSDDNGQLNKKTNPKGPPTTKNITAVAGLIKTN